MKNSEIINLIVSIILILSIGVLSGYSIGYFQISQRSFPNIKTIEDINQGVTTIKLFEIRGGKLIGEIGGRNARLAYNSDNIIEIEKDGTFEIPLNQISLRDFYVSKSISDDTQFIASKSGKYYYSIFDKKAFNLSESNRIYFTNEEDAENAGYMKR